MTLIKCLQLLALLTLIFGLVRIIHMFRARAMRALAARWGFQYIGPPAPKWLNPSHPRITPPLPVGLSRACQLSGMRIRQLWNVIEGQESGISVFIFDGVIGIQRRRALHCYRVPDRKESIRNRFFARPPNSVTWMDVRPWSLVSVVFVDNGHKASR